MEVNYSISYPFIINQELYFEWTSLVVFDTQYYHLDQLRVEDWVSMFIILIVKCFNLESHFRLSSNILCFPVHLIKEHSNYLLKTFDQMLSCLIFDRNILNCIINAHLFSIKHNCPIFDIINQNQSNRDRRSLNIVYRIYWHILFLCYWSIDRGHLNYHCFKPHHF